MENIYMVFDDDNQHNGNISQAKNKGTIQRKKNLAKQNVLDVFTSNNKLTYKKVCVICHKQFTAHRSDALTCNDVCRRKARRVFGKNEDLPLSLGKKLKQIEHAKYMKAKERNKKPDK